MTQCCKAVVLALVALVALTGCGGEEKAPKEVVLVTHDSFAVSKPVWNAFERETSEAAHPAVRRRGRGAQQGFSPRATRRATRSSAWTTPCSAGRLIYDLFEAYDSPELAHVPSDYILDREHRVTPIDHGEVCPTTTRRGPGARHPAAAVVRGPRRAACYQDLLVVENPATSSPRLMFLLATIARFGFDGWQDHWRELEGQRRSRRRRLGRGVHRALLRLVGQGQAADRCLLRVQPARRGRLRRQAVARGADLRWSLRRASGRWSSRACAARRAQRGRRRS